MAGETLAELPHGDPQVPCSHAPPLPASEIAVQHVALDKRAEPNALEGLPDDQIPFSGEQADGRVQLCADCLPGLKRHVGGGARHGRRRSLSTNGDQDGGRDGA